MVSGLLLGASTLFVVIVCAVGGPLHASCTIEWSWDAKCTDVNNAIVKQIALWKTDDNCKGGGEKCLYALVSRTDRIIKATHTTPKKGYVDDLTFTFTQNSNICNVNGHSTSETWYAVLDYSTNYCNLNNLITGAGLDKAKAYSETTSDRICTQYSSRNCDKY
ncbi:unnamed protein product [Owenia fusiformis]|uniref:Uncharacterized protein n=1 Tax=Owenia fusiformis TaxID=6347 RepID=A0A8S4PWF2_OWEFU|nr:unnamed protein product [Owenia fusiformis]